MHVLLTTDAVGGVWTYSLELARALGEWNVEVTLVTFGPTPDRMRRREATSLSNVRLLQSPLALEWMTDPWDEVDRAGEWLLELEQKVRPDIVHLNQFAFGGLPWQAPALVVGHSCVYSWYEAVCGDEPGADYAEYRRRITAGLRGADAVATPTAAMMRSLERHYGPFSHRHVIPNGRDPISFRSGRKEDLVLTVGRMWDRGKNMLALEDAAALGLSWPVYAIGPVRHPNGGTVRPRNLTCTGPLDSDNVARWLGRAAIYAHPAHYEPFGLCVLEAALAGCALVLSDITSLRELWSGCALFVPPHDTDELASGISRLIARPTWRRELARRARQRALGYTPARMAANYMQLYLDLTDHARGRSHRIAGKLPERPVRSRSAVG